MPQRPTPPPRLPPRAANDQTPPGPRPRTWSVRLIRKRAQILGYVDALEKESAEAAAVEWFKLTPEQRKRLIITERR